MSIVRRIRFSLRQLMIVVTLVGLYIGTWEITRRFGPDAVDKRGDVYGVSYSPMPLIVRCDESLWTPDKRNPKVRIQGMHLENTVYYFVWCGPTFKVLTVPGKHSNNMKW